MCSTLNGALRPGSRRFNTEPRGRRFCVSYPSRRPCTFPRGGRSTEGYAYSGTPAGRAYSSVGQPSVSPDAGRFMSTASALETPAHPPHTDGNLDKVGGSHNRPSALPGIGTGFTTMLGKPCTLAEASQLTVGVDTPVQITLSECLEQTGRCARPR